MLKKLQLLNAWQIKLIIAFLMLLNHLHFVYGLFPEQINNLFWILSRGVAPMFGYLAVEGIFYTKDKKDFVLRLWIWTLLVTVGNYLIGSLLTNSVVLGIEKEAYLLIKTNICFTLAFIVTGIIIIDKANKENNSEKYYYYILAFYFLLFGFISEWGVALVPFMLASYFFRENHLYKVISYSLITILAILIDYEPLFLLVFPLILLYNGKRGRNKKFNKYFFYIFYPLHLWLIAIINYYILR